MDFWTRLSNPHRFHAYDFGGPQATRKMRRLDTWGPMDDSRGRAMQSYVDPLPDIDEFNTRINNYKPGNIPTNQQCVEVLQRWLRYHDLDEEQSKDFVWLTLSEKAKNNRVPDDENYNAWRNSLHDNEVVDFASIKFEIYKVLKLGGGASSREAHSRLYKRTTRSCNIFLRYQNFLTGVDPDDEGDAKLDYGTLNNGASSSTSRNRRQNIMEVIVL